MQTASLPIPVYMYFFSLYSTDLEYVDKVRQMVPVRNQKRNDLYDVTTK